MRTIAVTGCAGFIGWKVSEKLLENGYSVVGIDNSVASRNNMND